MIRPSYSFVLMSSVAQEVKGVSRDFRCRRRCYQFGTASSISQQLPGAIWYKVATYIAGGFRAVADYFGFELKRQRYAYIYFTSLAGGRRISGDADDHRDGLRFG